MMKQDPEEQIPEYDEIFRLVCLFMEWIPFNGIWVKQSRESQLEMILILAQR